MPDKTGRSTTVSAGVLSRVTPGPSKVADRLATGDGGQRPVGVRRHRLADEADAAVAEKEVAPAGVDAPEAGGGVIRPRHRPAVRAAVVVVKAGQAQRVVHR